MPFFGVKLSFHSLWILDEFMNILLRGTIGV